MTFEELWRLTRRYWIPIVASALAGVLLSVVFVMTRTPQYNATSTAYVVGSVDAGGGGYADSLAAQTKAKAWLPLFRSNSVAQRVIKDLDLDATAPQLAKRVTVVAEENSPAVTVSATASSPTLARDVADAVVKQTAAETVRLEGKSSGAQIKVVSSAAVPTTPSYPRPERILPIGLLAGLILGYVIALVRRRRDTHIRGPEDVETYAGTSVLAVIPTTSELASGNTQSQSFQTREALRQLRTNVRFIDVDHSPRTIVITSARMGEGKSTTAANLAKVLAEAGEAVILVDADLRRPTVAASFGLESGVGLTQLLAGSVDLDDVLQASNLDTLSIIAAGQLPPNPSELLGSQRMRSLLEHLRESYTVIIDAPPLLPVTDASLLTAHADGCLLVVSADDTRQEHLERAVRNIKQVGGRVLGAVLNNVSAKSVSRIVYGDSSYGGGVYGEYGEYREAPEEANTQDAPESKRAGSRREVKDQRAARSRE